MVSKAREDLPEPLTPVTTVRASWGISTVMFFRLWTRAPRTRRTSCCWRVGAMVSFVAKGSSVSTSFSCCLNLKVYDSRGDAANWVRIWKSLFTSYPPDGGEVFGWGEVGGHSGPGGAEPAGAQSALVGRPL